MNTVIPDTQSWVTARIKRGEISKYLRNGVDFIDDASIHRTLNRHKTPDPSAIDAILDKSLSITTLTPDETAILLNVTDEDTWEKMYAVAATVKRRVYDNRIVTFAPLYTSNVCLNDCLYCGFRMNNTTPQRRILTTDEIRKETEILIGAIGHKRLIVVYGEHPATDVDYMVDTIRAIYATQVQKNNHTLTIRRVNVNAAPLSIDDFKTIKSLGIGTYQIFQETYHHTTYESVHPGYTIKGHYQWRLYCMHRALEAGIDDVGIGVLFGLYDWRFEVMGLVYHTRELEETFGVGPHTISFPRLEPAVNTPYIQQAHYGVTDTDFKKLVTVLRLAVPYTGLILTAREDARIRRDIIRLGCTQTDASTKIGIGAYSELPAGQYEDNQQFILGDTRSLDAVIRELAQMGYITSFCTAGYRCGRTGEHIMELLKCGKEGVFCKLNAILTFREWLDDFASPPTKAVGEKLIAKEIQEVKKRHPRYYEKLCALYNRIARGERDLFF